MTRPTRLEDTAARDNSGPGVARGGGRRARPAQRKRGSAHGARGTLPDCGKEPQIRRERLRARRLTGQVSAATGITWRRIRNHTAPDEIARAIRAAGETEGSSIRRFVRAGTSAAPPLR